MTSSPRRTKIVATIGPASADEDVLATLIEAGMDGARLNFSHGTHADHGERARRIRAAQDAAGRPLALIADLQGPKVRVGDLDQPVVVRPGDDIVVAGEDAARDGDLPVAPGVMG